MRSLTICKLFTNGKPERVVGRPAIITQLPSNCTADRSRTVACIAHDAGTLTSRGGKATIWELLGAFVYYNVTMVKHLSTAV